MGNTDDQKPILDLVVCGDSIIRWIDLEKLNPNGNSKLVCLPGAHIRQVREAIIDLHNEFQISQLIVHVGCNLVPDSNPFAIGSELTSLLTEMKLHMPTQ